jgi:long-chain fatty acid transport protein
MISKLCLKARSEEYRWSREILRWRFFVCLALGPVSNFLIASGAQAGGLYLNEFATPSMGVAGAGAEAVANDASTNFAFHNPAGMTRLDGHEIQLGAGLLQGDTEFDRDSDTPFNGGNGGDQAGLAPLLGSHGVYSVSDDLKLGISLFSLSGASLDPDDDWTGRFSLQEINLLTLTANPSAAFRLNEWLSFGAGVTFMYADLEYDLAAPPVNRPTGGRGEVEVDGDDVAFGFNLGALVELSPRTRIGVTYVSKVEPEFSGDLKVKTGRGRSFETSSDVELTFPQLVRIGAYHELNDQWALLGTVGWEDWSDFDELLVSVERGSQPIPTDWKDTYHFSGGVHYRPAEDWLLQAGITFDTSPVSKSDRTAYLPMDRQIRSAVGAQYQWNEHINVGGAVEYIDLGDAEIDDPSILTGEYDTNRIFMFALTFGYKF